MIYSNNSLTVKTTILKITIENANLITIGAGSASPLPQGCYMTTLKSLPHGFPGYHNVVVR
jgi:hypothetical protein